MKDETFILLNPGEEQRDILDQYRLTEIFRNIWGNHMLDHYPNGLAVRNAIAAVKRFKGVDEVDVARWKDVIIDLMYSKHILGFKPWEYFSYGFENKSIAERLAFMPERSIMAYYTVLNTSHENFLQLGRKHLMYQMLKPYFKRDMCVLENDEQKDAFFEFCCRHPRFFMKPSNSALGRNAAIINCEDYKSPEELFAAIRAKGPVVCEELIVCEDSLRAIHPQSVNSVRIYTYLKTNGEVTIIQTFLKAGQGDAVVDNGGAGGILASVDIETGIICTDGADESAHVFPAHPDTGFVFKGFQIPRWTELKEMVLEVAPVFPGVPLIGWDVALSKDKGWQIIEGNRLGGIHTIQIATKTGLRKQIETDIEWDKRRGDT